VVYQLDLEEFYKEYDYTGEVRAACDSEMMVSLYLYTYCNKVRSIRWLEELCMKNASFFVISRDGKPDHAITSCFVSKQSLKVKRGYFVLNSRIAWHPRKM